MRLLVLYLVIFYIASLRTAHAYIDPGVGSYFLQILFAGLLGGVFLMKDYLLGFIRKIMGKGSRKREDRDKDGKPK